MWPHLAPGQGFGQNSRAMTTDSPLRLLAKMRRRQAREKGFRSHVDELDRPPTADEIRETLRVAEHSQEAAAREIGVTKMTMGRWCNGHSSPRGNNLERLLHYMARIHGWPKRRSYGYAR